jgi:hypothetical protein
MVEVVGGLVDAPSVTRVTNENAARSADESALTSARPVKRGRTLFREVSKSTTLRSVSVWPLWLTAPRC